MDSGGFNWTLLTIVGPALLAVVILWALLKNRGTSRAEHDLSAVVGHGQREVAPEADADPRDDHDLALQQR